MLKFLEEDRPILNRYQGLADTGPGTIAPSGGGLTDDQSFYLTNHHTASSRPWTSYRARYIMASFSVPDVTTVVIETATWTWTVGHFVPTRG